MVHTVLAMMPMGSGYWWVRSARRAVKEHRPAVNRMKNGSSFFGYTDTSWNAETHAHMVKYGLHTHSRLITVYTCTHG